MASTITDYSNLININYPVPGSDNDSQGFRTNFSNIRSALSTTGEEISDLQVNLVSLSSSNNFGGNEIKKATLVDCSIVLKNYSLSELSALTDTGNVENGTLVFVTDVAYNRPAYYHSGTWYAFTGTSVTLS